MPIFNQEEHILKTVDALVVNLRDMCELILLCDGCTDA